MYIYNHHQVSNTTTATVNAVQSPTLLITKTASVSPINVDAPGTYSAPGQFINLHGARTQELCIYPIFGL